MDAPQVAPAPLVGCPNCSARNDAANQLCRNCGNSLTARAPAAAIVHAYPGGDSAAALRLFAWLGLVGGIVLAVIIFVSYGTVDVPSPYGFGTTQQTNELALWIASGALVQGLVGLAVFHALAAAAENTAAIRRTLDEMRSTSGAVRDAR